MSVTILNHDLLMSEKKNKTKPRNVWTQYTVNEKYFQNKSRRISIEESKKKTKKNQERSGNEKKKREKKSPIT